MRQVPGQSFYIGGTIVCLGLFLLLWVRSREEGAIAVGYKAGGLDDEDERQPLHDLGKGGSAEYGGAPAVAISAV